MSNIERISGDTLYINRNNFGSILFSGSAGYRHYATVDSPSRLLHRTDIPARLGLLPMASSLLHTKTRLSGNLVSRSWLWLRLDLMTSQTQWLPIVTQHSAICRADWPNSKKKNEPMIGTLGGEIGQVQPQGSQRSISHAKISLLQTWETHYPTRPASTCTSKAMQTLCQTTAMIW